MAGKTFTKTERKRRSRCSSAASPWRTTTSSRPGIRGVGYNVQMLECPTNEALPGRARSSRNRGQCNPTYFTVGNLVQYLCALRDKHGMSAKEIVNKYVFLTAGACGPCRFGMYVTEYRKALRDAGFDGFRVVLFQQTGGLKQATGEESGLEMNPKFFWAIVKALFAGDCLNALAYRIRPYEVTPGDTDKALEQAKKIVHTALENQTNILARASASASRSSRRSKSIARSCQAEGQHHRRVLGDDQTEGDGNYQLQRFLRGRSGAEADIHLVAAWLLYNVWEGRNDTKERKDLNGQDQAKYGLGDMGPFDVAKKLGGLMGGRADHPRALPDVRERRRPLRLPPAGHGSHRVDLARVLQQRLARRRRPQGSRQVDHERGRLQGPHDAQREAVRLHAQRRRLRRRAEREHREVPRHDLLRRRDQR